MTIQVALEKVTSLLPFCFFIVLLHLLVQFSTVCTHSFSLSATVDYPLCLVCAPKIWGCHFRFWALQVSIFFSCIDWQSLAQQHSCSSVLMAWAAGCVVRRNASATLCKTCLPDACQVSVAVVHLSASRCPSPRTSLSLHLRLTGNFTLHNQGLHLCISLCNMLRCH